MTPDHGAKELQEFVRAHQVRWSARPVVTLLGGARRQVAFELELAASHGVLAKPPRPGCPECRRLFQHLARLARAIIPTDHRPSRHQVQSFDHSLHLDPSRSFRPEVVLRIQIMHRGDFFQPIDACQQRCLREMEASLQKLGARRAG